MAKKKKNTSGFLKKLTIWRSAEKQEESEIRAVKSGKLPTKIKKFFFLDSWPFIEKNC